MYLKDVINRIDHSDIKQISQIDITNWYSALYVKLPIKTKMKNKKAVKEITHVLSHMGYDVLCEIPVERYSLCKIYRKTYSLQYLKKIFYQRWNTNAYKFLVLEKIRLSSVHGHVSSDAIHHDVILSRHKQKKQSWM